MSVDRTIQLHAANEAAPMHLDVYFPFGKRTSEV